METNTNNFAARPLQLVTYLLSFCLLFTGVKAQNVGVGTKNPQYLLDVLGEGHFRGELTIGDTTGSNYYTLPNTDGSSGQVLKTDGSGNVSWQNDTDTDTDDQDLGYNNLNNPTSSYVTHEVTITNGADATIRDYYQSSTGDQDWARSSSELHPWNPSSDYVVIGSTGQDGNELLGVDNGSASGTEVGIGSIERFVDESSLTTINDDFASSSDKIDDLGKSGQMWDIMYSNQVSIDQGSNSYKLYVGADDATNAYFDIGTYDQIMDESSGENTFRPSDDLFGYLGTDPGGGGQGWWYLYCYNMVDPSLRSIKKDIQEFEENHYQKVMQDIEKMDIAFYRYKKETQTFQSDKATKYRPVPHIGTFTDEAPDYVKGNAFDGIDIYGFAALSMAGVKQLNQRTKKLEKELQQQQTTVEDFGSVQMSGSQKDVQFSASFQEDIRQSQSTPVISLTPLQQSADLYIKQKTSEGFIVATKENNSQSIRFDWVARAKVAPKPLKEEAPQLDIKVTATESEKEKLPQWWKQHRQKQEQQKLNAKRKKQLKKELGKAREAENKEKVKELEQELKNMNEAH